jgi:hypothetical protein
MKAAEQTTNARKSRTSTKATKTQTGTSSSSWLKQNTTRPKTVIVELQRNANGYSIKDAVVLSPINQHASRRVPVNTTALTEDINRRGIIA